MRATRNSQFATHNPQSATRNPQSAARNSLVIGAGAIGSLIGGKLAQSGQPVTLVGRPRFVDAVKAEGLRLVIDGVTQRIENVVAVASVDAALRHAAAQNRPYDLAILTVKSYDTAEALAELAAAIEAYSAPVPVVLSLQNGVGNEEATAARFGPERVLAGTITAPVEVPEAGVVRVTKPQFAVGLASWDGPGGRGRVAPVQEAFEAADITVTVYADARAMKWTKLLMNMIGNATSAVLAEPPDVTFADPGIADLEIDALREALAVMWAAGIRPINLEKYPLGTLAPLIRYAPKALLRTALRKIVGGARGGKMPSLYLDLEKGKAKNEVDWYNGAVVRRGTEVGVSTPVNRVLNDTVLHLATHPEERTAWRGNHERLIALCSANGFTTRTPS